LEERFEIPFQQEPALFICSA